VDHAEGVEVGTEVVADDDGVFVDEFVEGGADGRPAFEHFVAVLASLLNVVPAEEAGLVGTPVRDWGVPVSADEVVHEDTAGDDVDGCDLDHLLTAVRQEDLGACDGNDFEARLGTVAVWRVGELGRGVLGGVLVSKSCWRRKIIVVESRRKVNQGLEHTGYIRLLLNADSGPIDGADVHLAIVADEDVGLNEETEHFTLDLLRLLHLVWATHVGACRHRRRMRRVRRWRTS